MYDTSLAIAPIGNNRNDIVVRGTSTTRAYF
jgi:hypothetical protein